LRFHIRTGPTTTPHPVPGIETTLQCDRNREAGRAKPWEAGPQTRVLFERTHNGSDHFTRGDWWQVFFAGGGGSYRPVADTQERTPHRCITDIVHSRRGSPSRDELLVSMSRFCRNGGAGFPKKMIPLPFDPNAALLVSLLYHQNPPPFAWNSCHESNGERCAAPPPLPGVGGLEATKKGGALQPVDFFGPSRRRASPFQRGEPAPWRGSSRRPPSQGSGRPAAGGSAGPSAGLRRIRCAVARWSVDSPDPRGRRREPEWGSRLIYVAPPPPGGGSGHHRFQF